MIEFIYGMTHCCLEDGKIRSSKDVFQKLNKVEFWINVMHHHMKDTLQDTGQPRKFSSWVFIGQLYSETVLNG